MKILVCSDLHLEFYNYYNPLLDAPAADVIVLAGDIDQSIGGIEKFFKLIREYTDTPIVYVLGNHEYHGKVFPTALEGFRNKVSKIKNIHLLEKQFVEIGNMIFLGGTLWTNYNNGLGIGAALMAMPEHRCVKTINGSLVTPNDFWEDHNQMVDFLKGYVGYEGKEIAVVTHMCPSYKSVDPDYLRHPVTPSFTSDLTGLISMLQPKFWFHGHTHSKFDYFLGDTRVICNPHGYPFELSKKPFNHVLVET